MFIINGLHGNIFGVRASVYRVILRAGHKRCVEHLNQLLGWQSVQQ